MYRAMSGSFPFNIPGTPSAAFHSHDLRDAPLSPSAASAAATLHTVADEEATTPRLAQTTDDGPKVHLVKLIARGTNRQTNKHGWKHAMHAVTGGRAAGLFAVRPSLMRLTLTLIFFFPLDSPVPSAPLQPVLPPVAMRCV